ncbi:MAG: hypothetical protein E7L17_14495 [Clostridium sp.]|uniref:hypothetical protein n=1 Tax=Clostridium sp. TaxID=1506 RepID=UPI002913239C|nr:hypothetical protein [Clostridium sp.]MDU7339309.1 hypothetical protein [Clostridium sp.]
MSKQTGTCYHCYREYAVCAIRICPAKQKPVCVYCCLKCGKHTEPGVGVGCELIQSKI